MRSKLFKLVLVAIIAVSIITMGAASVSCKKAEETVAPAEEKAEEAAEEAAPAEEEAAEEEVKEEVVLTLMHDKGGNPNFQPYYEAMGDKTKELFGIDIEPIPYPTTDVFMSTVRAALPTSEAPDLFTWWSTYRMKELIDQDLLAETTDLWDNHKDEFPQGLRDAFTFDGKVYGYAYTQEYWPVWYNKDVFASLNLDEPETWDEFIKVCETLKSNGVVPLGQTVQARWPTFIMFEEMIIGQDPDLYVDLCEGRVKYTDPRVKEAFGVWKDLIDKGYFTDPATDLFVDIPSMFNNDELGMVLCGTWYYNACLTAGGVPDEKIGAFILPSHNDNAGKNVVLEMSPILLSKNAPNLEAAKKAVDYFMSSEGNEIFAGLNRSYPSNMKTDTSFLPPIKVKIADTAVNENYRILNRYWEATPTPICEAAVDKFAEFIMNPDSLDSILADLDEIADKYWEENK